ncbi:ATP-binding cassette domain-containing protein (plasmid) [Arthrobacter sp. zg-Y820]|uniref:ATP-binding cassette domain-containing protein n=1 Tax=Arthrobacter sp. zg-Y820 TaxID=2894192 RepID=UPI0024E01E0D|nr:ATP-binding cassette domain-containing protein [Arthrobacter sp. zg-Y820]WIB11269.1 ATP-binding cassette domain-containing protein [Arthrobacter sp. zg-Y820]
MIAAILIAAAYFGFSFTGFLSPFNMVNIAVQTAVISLVAFGMTGVIIVRGIDLSVGSSLALASVVGAQVLEATGGSSLLTIITVFAVALAVGAFNGFLVAVLKVNAFMATLGMFALARGAAISISGGASLPIANDVILFLGREGIFGIPWSIIVTFVALALFAFLLRRTMLGRWFFAVGGNTRTAVAMGIPARTVQFSAFVLVGAAVGMGALLTIGRAGSAQPMAGLNLEFSAITAAVIGGASLAGGRGSMIATFLGSIFVGVLTSGLSFAGVSQPLIYLYTGLLTVVAVIVSQREVVLQIKDNATFFLNSLRAHSSRRRTAETAADAGTGNQSHTLNLVDVQKSFSGVQVLNGISFSVSSGEIVALMGENGAGKSTLVKAIAGNNRPTGGRLEIDGVPVTFAGPEDARKSGIAVIHQHFSLVPDLTVTQNMFLGQELRFGKIGPLRRRQMERDTASLLRELDMPFSATDVVGELSVGHRQMIEIVRAVREEAWLVIMDEPTSALSSRERDHLYELIDRLKARNTAILYISHKMDEIYHLCSRAIVLRDGNLVGQPNLSDIDSSGLVNLMIGRDMESAFPYSESLVGERLVEGKGLSDGGRLTNASITVHRGEVVGLVGLMGSGRTELMRTVAGLSKATAGSLAVFGEARGSRSFHDLADQGLAFVPEDRQEEGIYPEMTVGENMSMLWLRRNSPAGYLSRQREGQMVAEQVRRMNVRPPDPKKLIKNLSGGNQQKVVLGKWLALDPELILLDDPTRGVDVGAKAEIHTLISEYKDQGAGVLLTSSEIPEVLSIADRIIVMRDGVTVGEYPRGVSEEQLMRDAFGEEGAAIAEELQNRDRPEDNKAEVTQ